MSAFFYCILKSIMFFPASFIALSGILIAAASFFMAVMMFSIGRDLLNRIFGVFCLAIFIWGISFYFLSSAPSPDVAKAWWKISHIGVIAIPILLVHIVYVLTNKKNTPLLTTFYLAGLFFLWADLRTNLLINNISFLFNELYYDSPPGAIYLYFFIFFQALILYAHYLLWRAYIKTKDIVLRERIRYFFMATLVGFLGGGLSFFPVFGYDIYPGTIITVALYPIILGYAILKYKLFNIRLVTAQIIALTIFIFAFIKLFFSQTNQDYILNSGILVITLGLGVYLVISVKKEVESRDRIERLAKDLEIANAELKRLDAAKSEFISLAGHQLRAPLTVIKGYTSMLMEGTFGEISKKVSEALNRVFISANNLTKLVSELLDLSRIESGRIKYEFKKIYLEDVVEKVLKELEEVSKARRIAIEFKNENKKTFGVFGDADKLYEVVMNLLDNALKYSTASPIVVTLKPRSKRLALSVTDKGIGIPKGEMSKLFVKFGRTEIAQKEQPGGMGLGLYFVKKIVEDHKGRIWAESGGLEKGSTFFVELPVK